VKLIPGCVYCWSWAQICWWSWLHQIMSAISLVLCSNNNYPGVHFTNVSYTAFSQKHKKTLLTWLFELLGSASIKAACKHVGEIDPWWANGISECLWRHLWMTLLEWISTAMQHSNMWLLSREKLTLFVLIREQWSTRYNN